MAQPAPIAPPPPLLQGGGDASSVGDAAKFGVLTVSDRASGGVYEDLSGPAILQFFAEAVASPWTASYRVVPDEREQIEAAIIDMVRVFGGGRGRSGGGGAAAVFVRGGGGPARAASC